MNLDAINCVRIKIKSISNDDSVWKILDLEERFHKHGHLFHHRKSNLHLSSLSRRLDLSTQYGMAYFGDI